MTYTYSANVKHDTNTAAVVAEMIEDGFAPDVAEWLARFIPSIPGALVGRRFKLTINDEGVPFTVEEIKALCNAVEEARESVDIYRNNAGLAAVITDGEAGSYPARYWVLDETGEAVEIE